MERDIIDTLVEAFRANREVSKRHGEGTSTDLSSKLVDGTSRLAQDAAPTPEPRLEVVAETIDSIDARRSDSLDPMPSYAHMVSHQLATGE